MEVVSLAKLFFVLFFSLADRISILDYFTDFPGFKIIAHINWLL
jgi:hypothetical protein